MTSVGSASRRSIATGALLITTGSGRLADCTARLAGESHASLVGREWLDSHKDLKGGRGGDSGIIAAARGQVKEMAYDDGIVLVATQPPA